MSFIPIIAPTSTQRPPSPRARELARKVSEVIEQYRREHRSTTETDIDQALRLAAPAHNVGRLPMLVAVILGLMVALSLALLLYAR
jgi:hypothetical protein